MTFKNHLCNLRRLNQLKKLIVLAISAILIVSGCTKNDITTEKSLEEYDSKIQELEEKINALQAENKEMKNLIAIHKKEKENFFALSNMATEFVRAHTQGNIEKMKELLSEEIEIVEKKNKIYAAITYKEIDNIEWTVYDKNSQYVYQDMVLQGYEYLPDDETYRINIREFYNDLNGNLQIPPTYLNLYFKQINGVWKIINLEFDV